MSRPIRTWRERKHKAGLTVVHGELVVEVVVALADGHKCGDPVVTRRVLVIEGRLS